jgi:outer membrane protein OmpA-like peptidoglycan-associated protein
VRRRAQHDDGSWEVFADLGQSLSLVLFLIVLYQFVQYSDFWVRRKVQIAQVGVASIIEVALADSVWQDKFTVCAPDGDRQMIVFGSEALFPSGSPTVQPAGVELFTRMRLVLGSIHPLVTQVSVEGHTDTVRVVNDTIDSNWELSALRALRVAEVLLADNSIAPQGVSVVGRGQWQPIRPNDSEEGRKTNRRVEITLIYSQGGLKDMDTEELERVVANAKEEVRARLRDLPLPADVRVVSQQPQCRG